MPEADSGPCGGIPRIRRVRLSAVALLGESVPPTGALSVRRSLVQPPIQAGAAGDASKRPADDLIEAQVEFTTTRKDDPGWWPIAPESPARINTTLMAGWTRDHLLPFVLIGQHRTPTPGTDVAAFRKFTDAMMGPTRQLAQDAVKAGQKAFLYNFAWNGPDTGLGDRHTIELPFLLGSEDAWKDAPMLKGAAWTDIEAKGHTMRAIWANYARDGVPSVKGMPPWPAGTATEQPVVDLPPS
jgi:hypothetical protein